jgi:Icc protein
VRILQLSDPHLYADPEGRLLGLKTLETLNQVLEQAQKELPPMDLALVTGDLVHDASPEGYGLLQERLTTLGIPTYCIPGNHDDPALLASCLNGNPVSTTSQVEQNDWLLILLDSKKPGEEKGLLNAGELDKLASTLDDNPDKHTLVCLHHNPVPVGSGWLDTMQLENADEFFSIIDRHPQVRGIIWGHVHQAFESERNGVRLIGTPSTCFQFTPQTTEFGLDEKPPGCRWLALLPDGEIKTDLLYLDSMPASLERATKGY